VHSNMQPTLSPKLDWIAWIWIDLWGNFVCICRSSMTLTRQTCQLAILLTLCITSNFSSQENATPLCRHWHATNMFALLNSPHYTNNTCKVIHSVMVLTWIEEGPHVGGSYKTYGNYCKLCLQVLIHDH